MKIWSMHKDVKTGKLERVQVEATISPSATIQKSKQQKLIEYAESKGWI